MKKLLFSLLILISIVLHVSQAASEDSCKLAYKGLFKSKNFMGNTLTEIPSSQTRTVQKAYYLVTDGHKINKGINEKLNKLIDEIENHGGEFRLLTAKGRFFRARREKRLAYFTYDLKIKKPIIAVELNSSWSTVSHEFTHFQDWARIKNGLIQKGLDKENAAAKATDIMFTPKQRWRTEVNAVKKELEVEGVNDFSSGHIQRKIYPELVTIQNIFDQKQISVKEERLQRHYMRMAIMKTVIMLVARNKSQGAEIENYLSYIKGLTRKKLKKEMGIYTYRYELESLFDRVFESVLN